MAGRNLQDFLLRLQAELEKDTKTYRRYTSDVKPHTFYLSRLGLKNQILFQLQRDGVDALKEEIDPIISDYFKDLKSAFTGQTYGVVIHDKRVTNVSFSVTLSPAEDHKHLFTHKSSFELIKQLMMLSKWKFNSRMTKLYKSYSKDFNPSFFLDIGHADKSAVWDSRVSDNLLSFGEPAPRYMDIEEVALIFSLVKYDDDGVVETSLESASRNRSHGAGLKKDKVALQGVLADALLKLDAQDLDGSDSLVARKKKEIRKKALKPFQKSKNSKTKSKDLEFKKSSKTPTKAKKKRRITATKGKTVRAKKPRRVSATASLASQPLKLIGMLNQKLPETVRKNMQPPALENRTGRFANSVKITEIAKTRQGFPSIGYTYQRNPYEVFEEGSRGEWSNGERDPRDLIDKSIREIAAQFALGRFYTRRV